MNQPPLFRETRVDVMQALIEGHPFATLVSMAAGRLCADHIPLVIHPELGAHGVLRGHVAASNPLWRDHDGPLDVLAIFQGPQAYITPSWYPSKQEHGKVVPTWNYAVVHARGALRFERDATWLMTHLASLTDGQEQGRDVPWSVDDAPDEYMARQLKGLVGIEIPIDALEGTWKVSQNKASGDREGVQIGLAGEGAAQADAMAALIRDRAR